MRTFVLALAALAATAAQAQGETRLLRYPDVSRTHIAFVYGGDLYLVGRDGGTAQRLTSHEGLELYPKFSPDGSRIAFSAEYSGTRQVYVMPAAGGTPRQLTYYTDVGTLPPRGGTDYRVLDWTPDGRHIVVRANRVPFDERGGRPYLVPVDGGMERPMPMPETGGGSLSPDGTKFAYTPIEADWRGWKRYRGGRAPDVWVYDLSNDTSVQLTNFRGMDMNPAWVGDTIYFASDRDYTLNLYGVPAAGGEAKRLTEFTDYDVLWTSGGPDAVVFEQGGWVWRYDHGGAGAVRVPIRVATDAPYTLPSFKKVAGQVESFELSPKGERAVFGARGEIFTLPAKNGEPRNVSRTPAAREISVSWSPDGRSLAYLSDASGEYEIYVRPHHGRGEPRRITHDGDIWRFAPVWSPDSRKLAYADKKLRLRIVELDGGRTTEVDTSDQNEITEYAWSPDSRYLAYTKTDETRLSAIWLHDVEARSSARLIRSIANDSNPAFDPQGRYLYFVSNRDFGGLTFSAFEFNYLYTNATRIYAVQLAQDGPALNRPKLDDLADPDAAAAAAKPAGDEAKPAPVRVELDRDGIDERIVALNVPPGQYLGVSANATNVFFLSGNAQQGPLVLKTIALDGEKPEDVASGVTGYAISGDGQKLLVRQANDFAIVDAKPAQDPTKSKLAMERMEVKVDPRIEWRQQYDDAWRILRDWFYDADLHGGRERWATVRERYAALVPHLAHRSDFDYILHEVAGEANAGHVYVNATTDVPSVARRPGGFLGAEVERHDSGHFRITRIFRGENWDPANRSPLTEPGVAVREGEYIVSIDGVAADSVENFYQLLENKAERVVVLQVNDAPRAQGAREVLVKTIASERTLRYLDWVAGRRALVDRLSGGRIGYVHVPNTATEGNRELAKWWPAIAHKDAIIIDDRYNGGGFIPDRMIELVARTPLNYWKRRGMEPQATPFLSHAGPKAMLINGMSSSGGDAFPYYFRKLGLGPLIGTRTWGGLIGISGNPQLADGGGILAATFRFMDPDGGWAVENEGVAPDIEVVDRPELLAKGRDPSIEKAVEVLLAALAKDPPRKPTAPPAPQRFGGE
ncbi:MAG TPA: PDZ domain-containing protein [Xanthomonadales bacterium]|nr:PDZ domain-containing protein [Xanthomonadales bacterium]